MSIVRVGLAENKKFADGYDAIFGKKKKETEAEPPAKQEAQTETKDAVGAKKKPAKKKS